MSNSEVSEESLIGATALNRPRRHTRVSTPQKESEFSEEQLEKARTKQPVARLRGERMRSVSNFSQSREQLNAFFFLCRSEEVKTWIQEVLQRPLDIDLVDFLKDGTVLCELANAIFPNTIPKIHSIKSNTSSYMALENIQFFLNAANKIGVTSRCDPFMPIDLYEEKHIPKVVNFLLGFEAAARKSGFKIALKRLEPSQISSDRFTEAQLLRAQESLKMHKLDNLSVLFHQDVQEVELPEENIDDEDIASLLRDSGVDSMSVSDSDITRFLQQEGIEIVKNVDQQNEDSKKSREVERKLQLEELQRKRKEEEEERKKREIEDKKKREEERKKRDDEFKKLQDTERKRELERIKVEAEEKIKRQQEEQRRQRKKKKKKKK